MIVKNTTNESVVFRLGRRSNKLTKGATWELPDDDVDILTDAQAYVDQGYLEVVKSGSLVNSPALDALDINLLTTGLDAPEDTLARKSDGTFWVKTGPDPTQWSQFFTAGAGGFEIDGGTL
jgi:hypothetical protein